MVQRLTAVVLAVLMVIIVLTDSTMFCMTAMAALVLILLPLTMALNHYALRLKTRNDQLQKELEDEQGNANGRQDTLLDSGNL